MTATKFALPDLGEGLVEATVIHWHVPVGCTVGMDETLVEVETAKAVTEIPSPVAGTVLQHGAGEGEVMSVGELLALIGDSADEVADAPPAAAEPAAAAPIVGSLVETQEELAPIQAAAAPVARRPAALPPVRKLAKELGIDLTAVRGSGRAGRITRQDVEAHAQSNGLRASAPATAANERVPMSVLRRTIAANVARSWAEIPQVTAFDEVDATRLLAVRKALRETRGANVSIDALLVAAVIPALKALPVFNASLDGDDLVFHHRHDVGVAVDTPDGVIVAVIHDAGTKSMLELAAEIARLSEAARARTLQRSEITGQTFTVTNIGAAGGNGFGTPLVPYGTVGILSAGRAKEQPVARAGQVAIAPVMPLSFSYDHRIADGALGRRFLALLVDTLTEPALLLA
jgi:pyruvate dehydrogenase E2 component (dihydrolipoamide acetyltransferase)